LEKKISEKKYPSFTEKVSMRLKKSVSNLGFVMFAPGRAKVSGRQKQEEEK
jgi:hypothetical protein